MLYIVQTDTGEETENEKETHIYSAYIYDI